MMKSPSYRWALLSSVFLVACLCTPCRAWSAASPSPSEKLDVPKPSKESTVAQAGTVSIPGPLRSFLRMAAISQQASPKDILPLLAHNVTVQGYNRQAHGRKNASPHPTEYLTLLEKYVEQARELKALAGAGGVIRVASCGEAGRLLETLGYRLAEPCGPNTTVEAADRAKAFLTVDSGFPLTELEETLRGGKPFAYVFPSTEVPVLFSQRLWLAEGQKKKDVLDALIHDPALARLYWALARIDPSTRSSLRQSPGLQKLAPLAPVLDYYGSLIRITSGHVAVPGGASAEPAWKDLVGASPAEPGQFVLDLLEKDHGWLAAYYDALSRASAAQQKYFTDPARLQLFYGALRGKKAYPGAARRIFRENAELVLLVTQLQLEPNGQPDIPGGLDVWKEILGRRQKHETRSVRIWTRHAKTWKTADQMVACLFALTRAREERNPVRLYLTLSQIDRGRSAGKSLGPKTVRSLADQFPRLGDQYRIFTEFHALSDQSLMRFLSVAGSVDGIHDTGVRAETLGIFQANVGLWQILARQGEIPKSDWDRSWQQALNPFNNIRSLAQLYGATHNSMKALWQAAAGDAPFSEVALVDLLAGPRQTNPEGEKVRQALAGKIVSVLNGQRLNSLDTLFALGDGLNQLAQGKGSAGALLPLAGELQEFQLPVPILPEVNRHPDGPTAYDHLKAETQTDLSKLLKSSASPEKLREARGQIVPFLRDTLVGLNYAYYAPPGAQLLYHDSLFVRMHDFSGERWRGEDEAWRTPELYGRGYSLGRGAHLVGSLANLPYVLAKVEQNYIVPENVQALIWEDMVPSLLTGAVLPRWWHVTPNELHAAALYQRYGEELLTAAAGNQELRLKVTNILFHRLLPGSFEEVEKALGAGNSKAALAQVTPGETFFLAEQFRRSFPDEASSWGPAGKDLDALTRQYPQEVSLKRLSRDFGVPHPVLEQTYALGLLNARPFPTYFGYSSRLLAESWDSNNLYWARLADESGYPPVMLNLLVPELTQQMVKNIFATYLGDWPALLRALHQTGQEFREGKVASLARWGGVAPL